MKMNRITPVILSVGLILAAGVQAAGDLEAQVARARSAAPASISADATIMVDGKVVVEGSNGWTCMPDTMPGDGAAMCNDETWMRMMQAVANKEDFVVEGVGISYMLQGDMGAGVSNATPYHPDPKNAQDYVETGPHLMIAVPKELLKNMTRDFTKGGPYVMWGDTPYAHIMVPVADVE